MYGQIATLAFIGIEARPVEVEVRITSGKPVFNIVGLPDKAVAESRERVRNALHATGLGFPYKRVAVNLAPADLPKEGSHFDLPIALALMSATGAIAPDAIAGYAAIGELGLDGSIRPVPGTLPAAIGANAIGKGLICPASAGSEAAWAAEDMAILAAPHLLSLVNHFAGRQVLSRPEPNLSEAPAPNALDLRDVRGQESAKRALEIAAAGGHNLLMVGPPGSGKSMLAERLPSILPPLEPAEMLEVSMVMSLAGELADGRIARRRPFRAPHHSASMAALVGGGSRPRPGEVSLAHRGVLFLDELPEFNPNVLDSLRQPLESGEVVIARASHRIAYPAQFQLVAAMNPCKCGGGAGQTCRRGPRCAADYQARLSGPFLDRIDLRIELPQVSASDLVLPPPSETSSDVAARVAAARLRQSRRYSSAGSGADRIRTNAECSVRLIEQVAMPDAEGLALLRQSADRMRLSARSFHRILKVARTIADLDGADEVRRPHIAEALSYRAEVTEGSTRAAA
jgi:magnesium chelatase family protein